MFDGLEILTYHTDPFKADTDGDGINDGNEVAWGTDPLTAEPPSQFTNIVVQSFTGGDPGEGLDLLGNFLYAFNVGSPGAAGKAGDANFTADDAPGIQVTASNNIPNWATPEFGDTTNDNVLEFVMQSIRWSAAPARWKVELSGLVPGGTYKVQLLFFEQSSPGRGFNVVVDDYVIATNFIPANVQGGAGTTSAGAVVSAEFTTQRNKVVIVGDGPGADSPDVTDHNAILSGVTLEILSVPQGEIPLKINRVAKDAAGLSLTFDTVSGRRYAVDYRPSLSQGSWTELETNLVATGSPTIYLDNNVTRLNASQGFWRVRAP